ncbi:MAG: hypothetical protein ACRD3D_18095 [Terriglobia bacterium]
MRADQVDVSWDVEKNKWLVRVQAGDEVIRRHSGLPRSATEQQLRSAAQQIMQDEGYETEGAPVAIHS